MSRLDRYIANATRRIARRSSRRTFLARLGATLAGGAALPLLPVARAHAAQGSPQPQEQGDPTQCDYWRYCAIDGYLCSCCGGSVRSCPAGTEPSPVTWIGTCRNPVDGKDYIISYNDCCGKSGCGRCLCNRNEGDRPVYIPSKSNDINWCHGTTNNIYHCSTAVVLELANAE
jgi:methylamine dehydrogenase light chain